MATNQRSTFHINTAEDLSVKNNVGPIETTRSLVQNEPISPNASTNPFAGLSKTSGPVNNTQGNSWMKSFFSKQPSKQTSPTNCPGSPGASTNAAYHHPDIDLSYITSRLIALKVTRTSRYQHGKTILVMSTPRENPSDTSSRQTAELVRDLLDSKHPKSYILYSLDPRSNGQPPYRRELFCNKVIDLPLFDENSSPHLIDLLCFCQELTTYLLESPSNIAVLHCDNGKNHLAFGTCSLLAYHKIFPQADQIVQYYELRRCAYAFLTMSQKRYIQYLCDLSFGTIERPHFNELVIKTISLTSIPLFNRDKNDCHPYIDIYNHENKKIFSTLQDANKSRLHSVTDNVSLIPVNFSFYGDITIQVSLLANDGGICICGLTINSNFSTTNRPELSYSKNELDGIDQNEKYPSSFRVTIDAINSKKSSTDDQNLLSKQLDNTMKHPESLFKDDNDFRQTTKAYEKLLKNPNDETNCKSDFPISPILVVDRQPKSKDNSTSPGTSNTTSPRNSQRFSGSFTNPYYNSSKQNTETSQRSSQNSSSSPPSSPAPPPAPPTLAKEKEKIVDIPLVDIDRQSFNGESIFTRSMSSDAQQYEFNSSVDSQTNLLDDDFHPDKSSSQTNSSIPILPQPLIATTISKAGQKSTTTIQPSNTTPTRNAPDYNIKLTEDTPPSSRPQRKSDPLKPNHIQQPKTDIYSYFDGVGLLNKDSKPNFEPPPPPTMIDSRKRILAKDLDPTVLKVREWTEGKKRNIRALLCSLLSVTWPGCGWQGCGLQDVITADQVKKVYRKAVVHIHPDKLRNDPNEALAKLIFVELNEAWSQFEQGSK